ncbi:hypothetical protein BGZ46_007976 [Entomortierella lignicola]|nr:hypothetical protein BGZ46_007976 [Entomortierella lignicola]
MSDNAKKADKMANMTEHSLKSTDDNSMLSEHADDIQTQQKPLRSAPANRLGHQEYKIAGEEFGGISQKSQSRDDSGNSTPLGSASSGFNIAESIPTAFGHLNSRKSWHPELASPTFGTCDKFDTDKQTNEHKRSVDPKKINDTTKVKRVATTESYSNYHRLEPSLFNHSIETHDTTILPQDSQTHEAFLHRDSRIHGRDSLPKLNLDSLFSEMTDDDVNSFGLDPKSPSISKDGLDITDIHLHTESAHGSAFPSTNLSGEAIGVTNPLETKSAKELSPKTLFNESTATPSSLQVPIKQQHATQLNRDVLPRRPSSYADDFILNSTMAGQGLNDENTDVTPIVVPMRDLLHESIALLEMQKRGRRSSNSSFTTIPLDDSQSSLNSSPSHSFFQPSEVMPQMTLPKAMHTPGKTTTDSTTTTKTISPKDVLRSQQSALENEKLHTPWEHTSQTQSHQHSNIMSAHIKPNPMDHAHTAPNCHVPSSTMLVRSIHGLGIETGVEDSQSILKPHSENFSHATTIESQVQDQKQNRTQEGPQAPEYTRFRDVHRRVTATPDSSSIIQTTLEVKGLDKAHEEINKQMPAAPKVQKKLDSNIGLSTTSLPNFVEPMPESVSAEKGLVPTSTASQLYHNHAAVSLHHSELPQPATAAAIHHNHLAVKLHHSELPRTAAAVTLYHSHKAVSLHRSELSQPTAAAMYHDHLAVKLHHSELPTCTSVAMYHNHSAATLHHSELPRITTAVTSYHSHKAVSLHRSELPQPTAAVIYRNHSAAKLHHSELPQIITAATLYHNHKSVSLHHSELPRPTAAVKFHNRSAVKLHHSELPKYTAATVYHNHLAVTLHHSELSQTTAATTLYRNHKAISLHNSELPRPNAAALYHNHSAIKLHHSELPQTTVAATLYHNHKSISLHHTELPKRMAATLHHGDIPNYAAVTLHRDELPKHTAVTLHYKDIPNYAPVKLYRSELPKCKAVTLHELEHVKHKGVALHMRELKSNKSATLHRSEFSNEAQQIQRRLTKTQPRKHMQIVGVPRHDRKPSKRQRKAAKKLEVSRHMDVLESISSIFVGRKKNSISSPPMPLDKFFDENAIVSESSPLDHSDGTGLVTSAVTAGVEGIKSLLGSIRRMSMNSDNWLQTSDTPAVIESSSTVRTPTVIKAPAKHEAPLKPEIPPELKTPIEPNAPVTSTTPAISRAEATVLAPGYVSTTDNTLGITFGHSDDTHRSFHKHEPTKAVMLKTPKFYPLLLPEEQADYPLEDFDRDENPARPEKVFDIMEIHNYAIECNPRPFAVDESAHSVVAPPAEAVVPIVADVPIPCIVDHSRLDTLSSHDSSVDSYHKGKVQGSTAIMLKTPKVDLTLWPEEQAEYPREDLDRQENPSRPKNISSMVETNYSRMKSFLAPAVPAVKPAAQPVEGKSPSVLDSRPAPPALPKRKGKAAIIHNQTESSSTASLPAVKPVASKVMDPSVIPVSAPPPLSARKEMTEIDHPLSESLLASVLPTAKPTVLTTLTTAVASPLVLDSSAALESDPSMLPARNRDSVKSKSHKVSRKRAASTSILAATPHELKKDRTTAARLWQPKVNLFLYDEEKPDYPRGNIPRRLSEGSPKVPAPLDIIAAELQLDPEHQHPHHDLHPTIVESAASAVSHGLEGIKSLLGNIHLPDVLHQRMTSDDSTTSMATTTTTTTGEVAHSSIHETRSVQPGYSSTSSAHASALPRRHSRQTSISEPFHLSHQKPSTAKVRRASLEPIRKPFIHAHQEPTIRPIHGGENYSSQKSSKSALKESPSELSKPARQVTIMEPRRSSHRLSASPHHVPFAPFEETLDSEQQLRQRRVLDQGEEVSPRSGKTRKKSTYGVSHEVNPLLYKGKDFSMKSSSNQYKGQEKTKAQEVEMISKLKKACQPSPSLQSVSDPPAVLANQLSISEHVNNSDKNRVENSIKSHIQKPDTALRDAPGRTSSPFSAMALHDALASSPRQQREQPQLMDSIPQEAIFVPSDHHRRNMNINSGVHQSSTTSHSTNMVPNIDPSVVLARKWQPASVLPPAASTTIYSGYAAYESTSLPTAREYQGHAHRREFDVPSGQSAMNSIEIHKANTMTVPPPEKNYSEASKIYAAHSTEEEQDDKTRPKLHSLPPLVPASVSVSRIMTTQHQNDDAVKHDTKEDEKTDTKPLTAEKKGVLVHESGHDSMGHAHHPAPVDERPYPHHSWNLLYDLHEPTCHVHEKVLDHLHEGSHEHQHEHHHHHHHHEQQHKEPNQKEKHLSGTEIYNMATPHVAPFISGTAAMQASANSWNMDKHDDPHTVQPPAEDHHHEHHRYEDTSDIVEAPKSNKYEPLSDDLPLSKSNTKLNNNEYAQSLRSTTAPWTSHEEPGKIAPTPVVPPDRGDSPYKIQHRAIPSLKENDSDLKQAKQVETPTKYEYPDEKSVYPKNPNMASAPIGLPKHAPATHEPHELGNDGETLVDQSIQDNSNNSANVSRRPMTPLQQ